MGRESAANGKITASKGTITSVSIPEEVDVRHRVQHAQPADKVLPNVGVLGVNALAQQRDEPVDVKRAVLGNYILD